MGGNYILSDIADVDVQTTYSGIVSGISLGEEPYLITDEGSISIDSVIRVYDLD